MIVRYWLDNTPVNPKVVDSSASQPVGHTGARTHHTSGWRWLVGKVWTPYRDIGSGLYILSFRFLCRSRSQRAILSDLYTLIVGFILSYGVH